MATFIDGILRHQQSPTTFEIPTEQEKDSIEVGDYIKIGIEGKVYSGGSRTERCWAIVEVIGPNCITAKINNDLLFTHVHGLACDDIINVQSKNILSILKKGQI